MPTTKVLTRNDLGSTNAGVISGHNFEVSRGGWGVVGCSGVKGGVVGCSRVAGSGNQGEPSVANCFTAAHFIALVTARH